ncbi:hypothetical protein Clacol_002281 [Clathrus columnatus]|uniref:Uncharacterized protein n=1 Tax=Clathrus columnatus TaxID=1419009 RepID=A0AAV5A498_9AGAM|nr:hypothetical protein Clacol_002281 [Clathrus columnatus]
MADFLNFAKDLNYWTGFGLPRFNVQTVYQDVQSFFGTDPKNLPVPAGVSPVIWNNVHEPTGVPISKTDSKFFGYLRDTRHTINGTAVTSALNDFVVFLLGLLDYDAGQRIIHTQRELSFHVRDSKVDVKVDVAVLKRTRGISEYVLVVVEEKSMEDDLAQGSLIAAAIAAFCQNNLSRKEAGLPSLESQTILGITMSPSTVPTLYKIPVTKKFLHQFLEEGKCPEEIMLVQRLTPPVCDNIPCYFSEGMNVLANRWIILKRLNAFKKFLDEDRT